MRRLIANTVFSGLVMLCRFAVWPTRTSPLSVKATMEGVVRAPSAFSITLGVLPSMTATQELVVPKSIPMALAMTKLLLSAVSELAADRTCLPQPLGSVLDFDLLGLAARRPRNGDLQYAVRHGGLNRRRINTWRQLEHPIEHAVASFSEMVVLVFVVLLAFDLLLAADCQYLVLDRNLDIFALEPRHFRCDHNLLLGFGYVDPG